MDTERERERAYESIIPGELEGIRGRDWRPANCFEPERGACPTFTSPTKSNLPASNVRIVVQRSSS